MAAVLIFLFSLITSDEIINTAQQNGFYYKNVEIEEVKAQDCENENNFVKKEKHCWKLIRQDKTEINLKEKANDIIVEITPDKSFSIYYIYIEKNFKVIRTVIKSRQIEIKKRRGINSIQITAVGEKGPEVIYQRDFTEKKESKFAKTIDESIKIARTLRKLAPLVKDSELDAIAERRCNSILGNTLQHYDSVNGSVAHNNLKSRTIGENLFIAENEKDAWEMMAKSPSHLFNLVHPDFTKYGICIKKKDNKIYGAVIFSR